MKKTIASVISLVLLLPLALVGYDKIAEVPTDVRFKINGNVATYTDPHYQLTMDICHYDYFMYNLGFADPKDWIDASPSREGAPCRTLSLFYCDDDDMITDYTTPNNGFSNNVILVNG